MSWLLTLGCALLLCLSGCGNKEETAPPPPPRPRGGLPLVQAKETTLAQQPSQPAAAPTQLPAQAAAPVAATEAKEQPDEPEKKRDYSAELERAVGSPIDCLKPREGPDSPSEIDVQLEAYFLETGAMSRGYARSSRLDADELKCLQTKLSSIHLQAPIEGAPRAVQATLHFKLKTPL